MNDKLNIVLVEDNASTSGWFVDEILACRENAIIYRYYSEFSFLRALRLGEVPAPDFALIDLMLRYYSPEDLVQMNKRPDVREIQTVKEGGLRCRNELIEKYPNVNLALVTVLTPEQRPAIPDGVTIIKKGDIDLSQTLRDFLSSKRNSNRT